MRYCTVMRSYNQRHQYIKEEGINIEIGTFDRHHIGVVYIDVLVTVDYSGNADLMDYFEVNLRDTFYNWLYNQKEWNTRNYIVVFDSAESNNKYKGSAQAIRGEFHLIRPDDKITDWKPTVSSLMPLINDFIATIHGTCKDTGLSLRKWKSKEPTKSSLSS